MRVAGGYPRCALPRKRDFTSASFNFTVVTVVATRFERKSIGIGKHVDCCLVYGTFPSMLLELVNKPKPKTAK